MDLATYLSTQFVKFSESSNESKNDDEGDRELAATACIDVIKQIVDANISLESLNQIEPAVVKILEEAFTQEGS